MASFVATAGVVECTGRFSASAKTATAKGSAVCGGATAAAAAAGCKAELRWLDALRAVPGIVRPTGVVAVAATFGAFGVAAAAAVATATLSFTVAITV